MPWACPCRSQPEAQPSWQARMSRAAGASGAARSAGLVDEHGILETGRRADVVLLDPSLNPVRTLVGGETIWVAEG